MTIQDLLLRPELFPYRRRDLKGKPWYYAKFPNGDYFESSGNNKQIFFKTKRGLLRNLEIHADNLWQEYQGCIDGIDSPEKMRESFISGMIILELF